MIRTCDRPASLHALAQSAARYEAAHGRNLHYLVIDDSRGDGARNDEAVAPLREQGLRVTRLDRQWRSRFAQALPNPQIANTLLGLDDDGAITCGGAWNTASLLTAGRRVAMLDDDFLIDVRRRGAANKALGLSEPDEVPMSFAGGIDQLASALEESDQGPLRRTYGRLR